MGAYIGPVSGQWLGKHVPAATVTHGREAKYFIIYLLNNLYLMDFYFLMLEYFIKFITIYISGCRISTPWSYIPALHLN
jgi:hypothetical protein